MLSVQEFNSRFDLLRTPLYSFAYSLTQNREDAQDLVQETNFRAFQHLNRFSKDTNFRAWVVVIMRNAFINEYRKKKRRGMYLETIEPKHDVVMQISNTAISDLTMNEIRTILNQLDDTFRVPFLMFYNGYKYEEIASHLDIPLGTVKSRIFFARKKMKRKMKDHSF